MAWLGMTSKGQDQSRVEPLHGHQVCWQQLQKNTSQTHYRPSVPFAVFLDNFLQGNHGFSTKKYFPPEIPTNWYSIWHYIWHSMWHSFWQRYSDIPSGILFGTVSDIYIYIHILALLTFYLTYILTFYLTFFVASYLTSDGRGWCPAVPTEIWSSRLTRIWQEARQTANILAINPIVVVMK